MAGKTEVTARLAYLNKPNRDARPDEKGNLPPIGQIVEVNIAATFDDRPPAGTMGSYPYPVAEDVRSQIHNKLLEFTQANGLDYQQAKEALTEALANPKPEKLEEKATPVVQDVDDPAPEVLVDLDGSKAEVVFDQAAFEKAMLEEPRRHYKITGLYDDEDLRWRALAKLTLEEQKALGLADPRRLSREEFRHAMSDLIPSNTGGPSYEPAKRLLDHFDYMEELAEEMRRKVNA